MLNEYCTPGTVENEFCTYNIGVAAKTNCSYTIKVGVCVNRERTVKNVCPCTWFSFSRRF